MRTVVVGLILFVVFGACAAPPTPTATPTPVTLPPPSWPISDAAVEYIAECAEQRTRARALLEDVDEEDYSLRASIAFGVVDEILEMRPPDELALYHEARIAQWDAIANTYGSTADAESIDSARAAITEALDVFNTMEDAYRLADEARAGLSTPMRLYASEHCL